MMLFRKVIKATCFLYVILVFSFSGAWAKEEKTTNHTGLYAHRGFTQTYPENSLESVKAAIDLGLAGSEIDLRTTRDGHIVLLHDDTLDRVTNGTGPVADMPLSQVRDLFLKDKKGKLTTCRVPTLDKVLDLVSKTPKAFTLTFDLKEADEAAAAKMVLDRKLAKRVYFFIADPIKNIDTAKTLKKISPDIKIAVDLLTWWKIEGLPTFAVNSLDADALFASEWFFPNFGFKEAHQAHAEVFVYLWGTHDLKARMEKAVSLGADVVSCDRPDLLLQPEK